MSSDPTVFKEGKFIQAVKLEVKDEAAAEVTIQLLKDVQQYAKANEPGAITYRIHRYQNKVFIYEEYESPEAFQTHGTSEEFLKFRSSVKDLLAAPLSIEYYREV